MDSFLLLFVLLTLTGFLASVIAPKNSEKLIFWISTATVSLYLLLSVITTVVWLAGTEHHLFFESPPLYERGHTVFSFDLFFDHITMTYALVAGILGILISVFSRTYMHRDPGFKRFYNNILLFFMGLNLVILSGNFEVLFMGWEILGISSFLLIGYYRERYLPVKNAIKVVSLYRFSDICLLLAVWLCHACFGENINFHELYESPALANILNNSMPYAFLIPQIFMLVAAVKSAQLPFTSWLPRAMEGPTTSSAIFYGSLSVHIGLFLMLRLTPFWIDNLPVRISLALMGLFTSLVATSIANVQSSVKTQIAYSSAAQIGLMFIELALDLPALALLHFAGNAFLRTYQLLVSPSVLNYLIHDQFYNFEPPQDRVSHTLIGRVRTSLLMLSIKEWNIDRFQFQLMWKPFKWIGNRLAFLASPASYVVLTAIFIAGFAGIELQVLTQPYQRVLSFLFALIAFLLIMHAFAERASVKRAWLFMCASQFFVVLSVGNNEYLDISEVVIYLSGVVLASVTGWLSLNRISKLEEAFDLQRFYGHIYEHPKIGLVFLLSCLGLAGFPLTPTFFGMDLAISHVHPQQVPLAALLSLCFIFIEISALRIYARVFLGQHAKNYHEIAYRSS